jgi:hypothetical protein
MVAPATQHNQALEAYLDDPYAYSFRTAIIDANRNSTDGIIGHAGFIPEHSAFASWEPHPTHHLAYAVQVEGKIVIAVRIFDMLEAAFPVTDRAEVYLNNNQPQHGLFFLGMDSLSGIMHQSLMLEETRRLDTMVRIYLRNLPFPDPLVIDPVALSTDSSDGFTCLGLRWHWGWSWLASASKIA